MPLADLLGWLSIAAMLAALLAIYLIVTAPDRKDDR